MRIETVPKQVASKVYTSGCVQIAAALRNEYKLQDGSTVTVWCRVYNEKDHDVDAALVRGKLTSGGELYIAGQIRGIVPGLRADVVLLQTE